MNNITNSLINTDGINEYYVKITVYKNQTEKEAPKKTKFWETWSWKKKEIKTGEIDDPSVMASFGSTFPAKTFAAAFPHIKKEIGRQLEAAEKVAIFADLD